MRAETRMRLQGWLAGVALVAVVPGLIWAPAVTHAALAVYGAAMLVVVAAVSARATGAHRTLARAAIGASVGPWLALLDSDVSHAAALELSVVFALAAVASVQFRGGLADLRRNGVAAYLGLVEPRRDR